jgi:hypothetical protein
MSEPKKTITRNEWLRLIGLLVLAEGHNRDLDAIAASAREITGDEEHGHTADEVFARYPDANRLLQRLGITVEGE